MLRCDDRALDFVAEQLYVASESVEGPSLAPLLAQQTWGAPFSFLSPEDEAIQWRYGGLSDADGARSRMLSWVESWLAAPDSGWKRLLVLEESLWTVGQRFSKTAEAWADRTPFYVRSSRSSREQLSDAFRRQSGTPGVGALTRLPLGVKIAGALTPKDLNAVVSNAAAVLVGAWDEEAVLFAWKRPEAKLPSPQG